MLVSLRRSGAVLLALTALSLCSCTSSSPMDPGVVTVALDQTPDNLDPRIGQNAASQRLASLIFSSLVRKNEQSDIMPDLALQWEMPSPTTYVFHLRDDVRFHDGRQLTSNDVQFTFRSILDGSVRTIKSGHPYNLSTSVNAPESYTIIFNLREPFAPFLWNLANDVIGVVPAGSAADLNRTPVGSGPFEFVRHLQDQEIVLKRNDSYFAKKA